MGTLDRIKQLFGKSRQRIVETEGYSGPERRSGARNVARVGVKIMVVDDSRTIVAVLRKMLAENQFDVCSAKDGAEAIEVAVAERPALIFLDIVMPGTNGFSALRQLRRRPETSEIPIIMMSGNEQATEEFYVQRIGADDFMKKPFSRAEVFARIDRLLDAGRLVLPSGI